MFSMLPVKDINAVRCACEENGVEFGNTYMTQLEESNGVTGFCIYDILEAAVIIRLINVPDNETLIMTDTMLRAVMNRAELMGCKTAVLSESLGGLLEQLIKKRGFKETMDIESFLHSCGH